VDLDLLDGICINLSKLMKMEIAKELNSSPMLGILSLKLILKVILLK
jgi:hypothetical protein